MNRYIKLRYCWCVCKLSQRAPECTWKFTKYALAHHHNLMPSYYHRQPHLNITAMTSAHSASSFSADIRVALGGTATLRAEMLYHSGLVVCSLHHRLKLLSVTDYIVYYYICIY